MKKAFIAFVFGSCMYINTTAAQFWSQMQLYLHSFTKSEVALGSDITTEEEDSSKTIDNELNCTLIRVKFKNIPIETAEEIEYNFGKTTSIVKKANQLANEKLKEMWLYVLPMDSVSMSAVIPIIDNGRQFDLKSNILSGLQLEPKTAYYLIVEFISEQSELATDSTELGQAINGLSIVDWHCIENDIAHMFISHDIGGRWPIDSLGNKCAWVRVVFDDFVPSNANFLEFNFGSNSGIQLKVNKLNSASKDIWLFVVPTENTYLEVSLPGYGVLDRIANLTLASKKVYDVKLKF